MAVTLANGTTIPWSTLTPKRDSDTVTYPTWADQFGTGYNGDGTRFIFFANDGDDANAGTLAAPKQNCNDVDGNIVGMRSDRPDWMLFKKGDTFDGVYFFMPSTSGSLADPDAYLPLLTSYDPGADNNPPECDPVGGGAEPKLNLLSGTNMINTQGGGAGYGNTVCLMGLDFQWPNGNPGSASFTGDGGGYCLRLLTTTTALLVENCGFEYFSSAGQFGGLTGPFQYNYFYRNRFRRAYGHGLGGGPGGTFIQNFVDNNAWTGYYACTFTSGTNKVSRASGIIPGDGIRIKFYAGNGATLPDSIIENELYFVVNSGSPTAQDWSVASTRGGDPIAITGSPSGTLYFRCPGLTGGSFSIESTDGKLQAWYLVGAGFPALTDDLDTQLATIVTYPYVLNGNISCNSSSGMQMRCGGTSYNNLWVNDYYSHNIGAPAEGVDHEISYNVALGGGTIFNAVNAMYAFDYYNLSPIDYHHNIVAHGLVADGGQLTYTKGMTGGTRSRNIVYKHPTLPTSTSELYNGGLLTLTINDPGTGCDGRMTTFEGFYPSGSGGTSCVANIVGGTGGTDGYYPNVSFSGGTGANLRGNVTVSGGAVTAVSLNQGSDLAYTAGDTLTASDTGLPSGWSFDIYPYIVELREGGTGWTSQDGTGAQVYLLITDGGVAQLHLDDDTTTSAPYLSNTAQSYYYGGGVKMTATGGTGYSCGQQVAPYSLISGPPGATISDVPTGFYLTVGPYPSITGFFDGGISVSGGSGSGASVGLFFTTTGGVSTITSAIPWYSEVNLNAVGIDYEVNDILDVATYAGVSGVKLNVTSVTENFDDGTNIYTNDPTGQGWLDPEGATLGDYMTAIGNPGGFRSTADGFAEACWYYQRKATWNDLLMAESVNDYMRERFSQPMLGSAYKDQYGRRASAAPFAGSLRFRMRA